MSEDWDNCLIIDACRFDVFAEENWIPGTLEDRRSKGSATFEFFEKNFSDAVYHDTVYVTANPVPRVDEWCQVEVDSAFFRVVDVWEDHWDELRNTVPPGPVETAINEAHAERPDKRIIGHFTQPHQPFIGELGEEIDEAGMQAYNLLTEGQEGSKPKIWERLKRGEVEAELVWRAYRENLDVVLPHVETLCDELTGKTVVTSDHGNLFGEFAWPFPIRKYGHPSGVYTKKLTTVPWLEIESETRRDTVPEPPIDADTSCDDEQRLERLSSLGYR